MDSAWNDGKLLGSTGGRQREGAHTYGEVGGLVVIGEVPEACHPDVAGNEDADGVVGLARIKVMVEQEQHLIGGARGGWAGGEGCSGRTRMAM